MNTWKKSKKHDNLYMIPGFKEEKRSQATKLLIFLLAVHKFLYVKANRILDITPPGCDFFLDAGVIRG